MFLYIIGKADDYSGEASDNPKIVKSQFKKTSIAHTLKFKYTNISQHPCFC